MCPNILHFQSSNFISLAIYAYKTLSIGCVKVLCMQIKSIKIKFYFSPHSLSVCLYIFGIPNTLYIIEYPKVENEWKKKIWQMCIFVQKGRTLTVHTHTYAQTQVINLQLILFCCIFRVVRQGRIFFFLKTRSGKTK